VETNCSLPSRCVRAAAWAVLGLALIAPRTAAAAPHFWSVGDVAAGYQNGRRPEALLSRDYGKLLWDDTRSVLTSPLRWDRADWLEAGAWTAVVAGTAAFDGRIHDETQENRTHSLNNFTQSAQKLGSQYSWLVLGGFEVIGRLTDNAKAKAVAMDGLTASIIAAGIITPVLKYAVGRVRPNTATSEFQFKPFSGNYSFPSGHVTQAFAVASVIAAHYDSWWVQGAAYGLAGLVGYSRVQQNAHFTSDVVAGAVIGAVVGRTIVRRHSRSDPDEFTLAPFTDGRSSGLLLSRNF